MACFALTSPLETQFLWGEKKMQNREICWVEGKVQEDEGHYTWTAVVAKVSRRCNGVNRTKHRRGILTRSTTLLSLDWGRRCSNLKQTSAKTESNLLYILARCRQTVVHSCVRVWWWNLEKCRISPGRHVEIKMLRICYLCEGAQFVLQQIFVALDRMFLCAEPKKFQNRGFSYFRECSFEFPYFKIHCLTLYLQIDSLKGVLCYP